MSNSTKTKQIWELLLLGIALVLGRVLSRRQEPKAPPGPREAEAGVRESVTVGRPRVLPIALSRWQLGILLCVLLLVSTSLVLTLERTGHSGDALPQALQEQTTNTLVVIEPPTPAVTPAVLTPLAEPTRIPVPPVAASTGAPTPLAIPVGGSVGPSAASQVPSNPPDMLQSQSGGTELRATSAGVQSDALASPDVAVADGEAEVTGWDAPSRPSLVVLSPPGLSQAGSRAIELRELAGHSNISVEANTVWRIAKTGDDRARGGVGVRDTHPPVAQSTRSDERHDEQWLVQHTPASSSRPAIGGLTTRTGAVAAVSR